MIKWPFSARQKKTHRETIEKISWRLTHQEKQKQREKERKKCDRREERSWYWNEWMYNSTSFKDIIFILTQPERRKDREYLCYVTFWLLLPKTLLFLFHSILCFWSRTLIRQGTKKKERKKENEEKKLARRKDIKR